METIDAIEAIEKFGNIIARRNRHGTATKIVFAPNALTGYIKDHIHRGYRKKTTGQYVPKKYLSNFGWKNTYYQHATTIVALPLWAGWLAGEDL